MKWMVFSDTHLGSAVSCRNKDLYKLILNKIGSIDKLVINGDFLDLWRKSLTKIMENEDNVKLMDLLFRQLPAQGVEVVYMLGNHEDIDTVKLKNMFKDITFAEIIVLDNIVITHGHQFDEGVSGENRNRQVFLVKLREFIESIIHIDLRKLVIAIDSFFKFGISKKYVERVHKCALQKYSGLFDGIVIGHTHIHEQNCTHNSFFGTGIFTLYDTGNTYTNLNYFIFENGKLIETGEDGE